MTRAGRPAVLACCVGADGDFDAGDLMIETRERRRLRGDSALDALLVGSAPVAPQLIELPLDDHDQYAARLGISPSVTVTVVRENLYIGGRCTAIAIWTDAATDRVGIAAHNLSIDDPAGRELLLRQLNALWGTARLELADCRRRFPDTFRVPFDVRATTYEARRSQLGLGMTVNTGLVMAIVASRSASV
jgi:hypothetical protein